MNYAGYNAQEEFCAFGSMFVEPPTADMFYWETLAEHRGKGFHHAGIRHRVADAFKVGCNLVFTVSDYNFSSATNLQRCGFKLAQNYLVVTRDLLPVRCQADTI